MSPAPEGEQKGPEEQREQGCPRPPWTLSSRPHAEPPAHISPGLGQDARSSEELAQEHSHGMSGDLGSEAGRSRLSQAPHHSANRQHGAEQSEG